MDPLFPGETVTKILAFLLGGEGGLGGEMNDALSIVAGVVLMQS